MTQKLKTEITNAVYEVYKNTTEPYNYFASEKTVSFTVLTDLGDIHKSITIVRKNILKPTYELYMKNESDPFMTVFGCWPIGFVSDIFIRTVEHYFDLH